MVVDMLGMLVDEDETVVEAVAVVGQVIVFNAVEGMH
jgi:hypothetical protein